MAAGVRLPIAGDGLNSYSAKRDSSLDRTQISNGVTEGKRRREHCF